MMRRKTIIYKYAKILNQNLAICMNKWKRLVPKFSFRAKVNLLR